MNETASESDKTPEVSNSEASSSDPTNQDSESKAFLSYEGARIPGYIILIWLTFFIFGVIYFLIYLPDSIREWFLQGK